MDPIYLGGPRPPSEPMDQDYITDDDEEDQLLSDTDDVAPPPPPPPPKKPVVPAGQEIEPDPEDDEPSTSTHKRKGARKSGTLHRVPGYSLLPEDRVENILEENGAAGPMSKEATYLVSIATEEFIKRYAQAGYMIAQSNSRKVIEYNDLASSTSMRCFSMLEDVVPLPKPLSNALELRSQFIKRQIAEDPALTAVSKPPPPPDPHAPVVALPPNGAPPQLDTPSESKSSTPAPPTGAPKRSKTAPAASGTAPAGTSNGKRKAKDKATEDDGGASATATSANSALAKERRASTRQRDKHGRFGNNPIDPRVWDNKFAPAPAAAPPQDPWANAPSASLPGPPTALSAPPETPFAQTGRTIYSQR